MKRLFLLLALGWAASIVGCTADIATTPAADASSEDTPGVTITTEDSDVAAGTRLVSLNVPNMT